ncbi:SsrA-binding protein SmpB [Agrobacterium rubi]|nr:SsrA-binding protein SmpB [Agrobacterium rubi]NTF23898.1 SsrA-binding protein SmpB [Agrobacterium rubi]
MGTEPKIKMVAENRKARHSYEIGSSLEVGIVLTGSEVKSLRQGKANIGESYASFENGELWLINSYVPEFLQASRDNHAPRRHRKLLLHRREMAKLDAAVSRDGMTLVPTRIYFNTKGRAKVELALGRGRKSHDKREADRKRDWEREKGRILRDRG